MVKWAQIYCQLKSTGMTVAMYSVTLTRHVTLTITLSITQGCLKDKTIETVPAFRNSSAKLKADMLPFILIVQPRGTNNRNE